MRQNGGLNGGPLSGYGGKRATWQTACRRHLFALWFVALVALTAVPAASAAFSLTRLHLGTAAGPENYVYTTGNTVVPEGGTDAGTFYKFVVTDSSGAARNVFSCTPAADFSITNNSYSVSSADPASGSAAWKYTLQQFSNGTCTGTPAKSASKNFYVARVTTYEDSALTRPRSVFGAGQTTYLVIQGVTPGLIDWSTTWINPSGATACANTAANDRPDANSSGGLPKTSASFLQYRPNLTQNGSLWNRESEYETIPCAPLDSTNQGQWKLLVQRDATNFATLTAFTLDTTAPPAPLLTTSPPSSTGSTSATFAFTDSEQDATFECSLNGAAFASCSSPKTYAGLTSGTQSFAVRAADPAGNRSAATTHTWTVDATPPTVSLLLPAAGSATGDATPTFSGTAGTAPGDSATVTVNVYSGSTTAGTPIQTLTRDARAGRGLLG